VRNGTLNHFSENAFGGYDNVDIFNGTLGQLPNTTNPLFTYEPLSPITGIGATSDGHIYFINTDTDTATQISDTAGAGIRDVICDELSDGEFGCGVLSFDDATLTPCGGSNASDFTCGTAVNVGDGISFGLATTDNGNFAAVVPDFTDSSIHVVEFTPQFGVVLQAEFFPTQYLSLFAETGFAIDFIGHAEIDAENDAIIVSGNGSGNVGIIPIDDLAAFGTTGMTVWFN
jgi:hypothetical protein